MVKAKVAFGVDAMTRLKRLPLIRHARYLVGLYRVTRHYELWLSLGRLPVNRHLDLEVLDAIWRGEA